MDALSFIIKSLWKNVRQQHDRLRECRLTVIIDLLTVKVQRPVKSARPRAEDDGQRRPRLQLARLGFIVMTSSKASSRMAAGERAGIEFAMMVSAVVVGLAFREQPVRPGFLTSAHNFRSHSFSRP